MFNSQAKFFTESRLLQRPVRVQLLALPTPAAVPFANSASSAPPPPASVIIGSVLHPAGNIAEHLVAAGLARVVDWHAGMLSASGAMERLRAAEKYKTFFRNMIIHSSITTITGSEKRRRLEYMLIQLPLPMAPKALRTGHILPKMDHPNSMD